MFLLKVDRYFPIIVGISTDTDTGISPPLVLTIHLSLVSSQHLGPTNLLIKATVTFNAKHSCILTQVNN